MLTIKWSLPEEFPQSRRMGDGGNKEAGSHGKAEISSIHCSFVKRRKEKIARRGHGVKRSCFNDRKI